MTQPTVTQRTKEEIQVWLVGWIAKELRMDPKTIQVDAPFVNFGMGSRQAVLLIGEISDWLGVDLEPAAAWDYPTISALAAHLATTK